MSIQQTLETFIKAELIFILTKLKDETHHSYWKRSKLIEQVLLYDIEDVLKTFTSSQLKDGLELAGESTTGTKAERLKRLSSVWGSSAKNSDRPANSIKIEALLRQEGAFFEQGLVLLESMDDETQKDILQVFDAEEIKPYSNRQLFRQGFCTEDFEAKDHWSWYENEPKFEMWNLALMLHLHINSSVLQNTTSIDIMAIKSIPMSFWTTLIQKAPHIKRIRVLLEPIPEIDVAYELKPFVCIETDGILEKLASQEACAEWSLEEFALIEEMPWIEELTLTSDPNQVRPSYLEKLDCYVMASRHTIDPFPIKPRYDDWFWGRKSYIDLNSIRYPKLRNVVIQPNQTLMSVNASTASLVDIEIQTSQNLHILNIDSPLQRLSLDTGSKRPNLREFSVNTDYLKGFTQHHSMRGGLLPKFTSTNPTKIKHYFKEQRLHHVIIISEGQIDEYLQSVYVYNEGESPVDFKDRTGFEWSTFPNPGEHFGLELDGDTVSADQLSFSFPYFVDVLIDMLQMENDSSSFTVDPVEMVDDNTILACGLVDNDSNHPFAMTYQYHDPSKQTFPNPFNGIIPGYGGSYIEMINRPQNSNALVQEISDELSIRFEDDEMPFFMNVYQYSLLELIPYCTDEELKRIQAVLL